MLATAEEDVSDGLSPVSTAAAGAGDGSKVSIGEEEVEPELIGEPSSYQEACSVYLQGLHPTSTIPSAVSAVVQRKPQPPLFYVQMFMDI